MDDRIVDDKSLETKLAIVKTLDEMSKTRPFSRLGVADVAKELGISRSSFYYHFSDRNDAVQWLSKRAFAQGIDQIGRTFSWTEGHYATTRMLYDYRHLISAAADDGSCGGAVLFFRRYRAQVLEETLRMRDVQLTEDLSFQIASLAASEQAMTIAFLSGEFGDMTARAFCQHIESVVPKELHDALTMPRKQNAPAPHGCEGAD